MFSLDQVVPWGRSFDEYQQMFRLSTDDLGGHVLGCGDGPASFNAEATRRGARVTSCDPIYRWTAVQIRDRITATAATVLDQTRQNAAQFVWRAIPSVEALGEVRMTAMTRFLDDFASRERGGRYVAAELPRLPFADGSFDLALCSHFLFLYSQHFDEAFHHLAIAELCRVARELRVFPLVALDGGISPYVERCTQALRQAGYEARIEDVAYEFQRGAHQMLRVGAV